MARRISSLFGVKDSLQETQHVSEGSSTNEPSNYSPKSSLTMNKLAKSQPMPKVPSLLDLANSSAALPPPPIITEGGMRAGGRDSRRSSRTESPGARHSSADNVTTSTYLGVHPAPVPPRMDKEQGGKLAKRSTWIPGRSNKTDHGSDEEGSSDAWIAGLPTHVQYDMTPLLRGERVAELWDAHGNVEVYLFAKDTNRGPSFRLPSSLFVDSARLRYLNGETRDFALDPVAQPGFPTTTIGFDDAPRLIARKPMPNNQTVLNFSKPSQAPPPPQVHQLFLSSDIALTGDFVTARSPPKGDDIERLIMYRNFFAFLSGGALISTPRQSTLYAVFTSVSSLLSRFQFGNAKGTSWGKIPWDSFQKYTKEIPLGDVRKGPDSIVEAILIGEAMKSWPVYNEGFVHAVGRFNDVKQTIKYPRISPATINRLERANLDLQQRLFSVRAKLDNFYFPSMFAGVANSQKGVESRLVNFKAWKEAFLDLRNFVIIFYKRRFGTWPPKASSKKNTFEESGLNRLVLREIYHDFSDLYDMLVDRQSLTPRTIEMPAISGDAHSGDLETVQHILRTMESEYDRSVPPINPPIPFDVPLLPALATSFSRDHTANKKTLRAKRLKDSDVNALLFGSYNRESMKPTTFCQNFLAYERRLDTGKTVQECVDNRCGLWLFLYAVLQSLPMTALDAPDLRFTTGIETHLCIAPRGGRPWVKEDISVSVLSSQPAGNAVNISELVNKPTDIEQGVDGVYQRSHCWAVGKVWRQHLIDQPSSPSREHLTTDGPMLQAVGGAHHRPALDADTNTLLAPRYSPLLRPRSAHGSIDASMLLPGPGDTGASNRRSSMNSGLPETRAPAAIQRRSVAPNPNITFDDILGAPQRNGRKGSRK